MPSASLRSSSARPSASASPVRASPVTGFRTSPSSVSAPLQTLLPALPAACFAPLPSTPSAVPSTQSPWRLPSAAFADLDPLSLIPQVLRSRPHGAGSGSHTPRIPDAGGAIRTCGLHLSAHPPPFNALLLLDRAYVAPIHAGHPVPDHAGLRLSCTDIRSIHASRCPKHRPIHDRHALMMVASALATAFVSDPDMPTTGVFADIPTLELWIGRCIEPVHNTRNDHIRASHNPKSPRLRRSGSNNVSGAARAR